MRSRLKWLDTARGIGILLVVLGHALTTCIRNDSSIALGIYDAIYLFHMPLLFFVSGYAFNLSYERYLNLKTPEYLLKKVKKLIVPYVCYSFLIYILVTIAHAFPGISNKLKDAGFQPLNIQKWFIDLLTGKNEYCQHLWYIYSLFLFSALAFIFVKIFKANYKYAMLIISVALYFFWIRLSTTDLVILWKTFYRGIWFALGLNIQISNENSLKKFFINALGVILAISIMEYTQKNIQHVFVRQASMILSIFLIVMLCVRIASAAVLEKVTCLDWLGKNSFGIYLFHQPFFGSGAGVILYRFLGLPLALCVIISFILCIIIPILIVRILDIKQLSLVKKLLMG